MTARAPSLEHLRAVAQVAVQEGVTITIEAGNRVYRITPGAQDTPLLTTEKDQAACDRAFGLSN